MKINRALLQNGVSKTFEETIDFSSVEFDPTHIRSIPLCEIKARVTDYEEILRVEFHIKADVIGVCSYTLEDVPLHYEIDDEISFTDDPDDVDNYYEKGNLIEMDQYVLGILLANVPIKIVKKGAKLPKSGDGYRVMTEEEHEAEKRKRGNPAFDILDSVEFDED